MKKTAFIALVVTLLAFSACKKPASTTSGTLKLQVNPMFGALPMRLDSTYATPDGKYYYFDVFNFYLSHITLVRTDNTTVEVCPLATIRLDALSTLAVPLSSVSGSFKAIKFSIGMDTTQDAHAPDSSSASPYYSEMYWGTQLQFVFVQLQGNADMNPFPVQQIGYHVGTSPYYSTVTLTNNFTVSASGATTLTLNTDVQKIFYGSTGAMNISDPGQVQTSTPIVDSVARKFINAFDGVFSLTP